MSDLTAEAASGQLIGQRRRQEDAMIAQFPQGDQPGIAVLSDGMGGHDDGDLAGRILVSEMFGELYLAAARPVSAPDAASQTFRSALTHANARLKQHIDAECISPDTGGTLLCVTIQNGDLRWLSVGDSLLYLYRDGTLRRLNDLHSMAAQLDLMVQNGAIEAEAAATHPHRHCLTSAVTGGEISRINCPAEPLPLSPDDIIVLASDGLNVLEDAEIAALVSRHSRNTSDAIIDTLLGAVRDKDLPQQDNTSLVVIRVVAQESRSRVRPALTRTYTDLIRRWRVARMSGLRTAARRMEL